jgi:hypothetical protein
VAARPTTTMMMMMMMRMMSPAAVSAEDVASAARPAIPRRWPVKLVEGRRGKQSFLSG